jgi:hypothetical protein
MRRHIFTAVASVAILAMAPASALAKQHTKRHHSRTHHSRTHHSRTHRLRVRHERFGALTSPGSTTPVTPAQPAGTVDSLVGNLLTIRLNDANHTLVSGMVTDRTQIECAAPASTIHADGDQGGGDNSTSGGDNSTSGGDNTSGGDDSTSSGSDETAGSDDATEANDPTEATEPTEVDDQGDDDATQTVTPCTTANLVAGTAVSGAELGISSAGATWEKVELAG